jgi:hypothetical protein
MTKTTQLFSFSNGKIKSSSNNEENQSQEGAMVGCYGWIRKIFKERIDKRNNGKDVRKGKGERGGKGKTKVGKGKGEKK